VPREIDLRDSERLLAYAAEGASGVRVLLFHGLTGDADADYMRRTAAVLRRAGHGVWAVNHRGCGAGRGLAWRPYHSGCFADIADVVVESRRVSPELIHLVIGFSMSGNAALLLAAREDEARPHGILSVNPPVDLARSSALIHQGWNRLYERRFLLRLRREIHRRVRAGRTKRPYRIPLGASMCAFDDLFTAPEVGFLDGADYYAKCSSLGRLKDVGVPTVIVTAADDPFVDPVAYRDAELSSSVLLHIEASGGHVGYLTHSGFGWRRWLDGALTHYVDELRALSQGPA
jgi:predicted alpha/beta-fold hydrolase